MRRVNHGVLFAAIVVSILSLAMPAVARGEPSILGSPADVQTARSAGLAGRYVSAPHEIPDGAQVIVLGREDKPGGVDEIEVLNLVGRGCDVSRLSEKPWSPLEGVVKAVVQKGATMGIQAAAASTARVNLRQILENSPNNPGDRPPPGNLPQPQSQGNASVRPSGDSLAAPIRPPSVLGRRLDARGSVMLFLPFESERATFAPGANSFLFRILDLLYYRPALNITIHGHAESAKGPEAAQALSLERAQAVRDWLVKFGIAPSRVKAAGEGAAQPLQIPGADPGMTKINRMEITRDR